MPPLASYLAKKINSIKFFVKINVDLKNVHLTSIFGTFYDDFAMNYDFFKNTIFFQKHPLTGKTKKFFFSSKFASRSEIEVTEASRVRFMWQKWTTSNQNYTALVQSSDDRLEICCNATSHNVTSRGWSLTCIFITIAIKFFKLTHFRPYYLLYP